MKKKTSRLLTSTDMVSVISKSSTKLPFLRCHHILVNAEYRENQRLGVALSNCQNASGDAEVYVFD
ncbi:unnamed protein product, partial [Ceratitis capitata]